MRTWAAGVVVTVSLVSRASVEDTLALGRKALLNEGVATAWKLSQQALLDAPASAAAHEFAGEVLFRRGEIARAESEFNQALKLDSNFAPAWWGLARTAECQSMRKTADRHFRRAYELDPKDPRIFLSWALRLRGAEQVDALEKYASMVRNRDELEELRQRKQLVAAAGERNLMRLASPYKRTEAPLAKLISDGSRMRVYGLEVTVNGNTLRLLLDTGASGILLKRAAAEKSGVVRLTGATFRGIGDNTKTPGGYHGIAETVRIGEVEFRDALINVAEQDFIARQDGLIGVNVFSQFLVTLDFPAQMLRLAPLPDYRGGDEPEDRAVPAEMQNFTRVFRFGHMLLIPTRVGDSREVLFVLDTGATRTLISYDLAAEVSKINPDDRTRLTGINGKVADVYQTGNLFLQFAGFRQKNPGMTAFDMWSQSRRLGTEVSGLLGLPLLNMFTLTIDYRDGLVHFDYKGH